MHGFGTSLEARLRLALSTVKDHPSIWYHVDAAWAGVAFVCPEFRSVGKLDAINKYADSFCTNFHKVGWAFVALHNISCADRINSGVL